MQDPRGFLRFPRIEPDKEQALTRIRHWREYERLPPERQTMMQAARCIDCGTPACHRYCPVHNLIPDWNTLVDEARWREAWQQLESTNNFPEFTGRLCPAPCEDACTLRLSGTPVTIRAIELAIVEHAFAAGWVRPQPPQRRRFNRVAVVGSGPAGLACAQQLARAGYRVTVYEKADRIGGLLRYGIPDFRLEKWVLERRLAQMAAEGVRFCTNAHVGVNIDPEELRRATHALVFAGGATVPRDLDVPGRTLAGIHFAFEYLQRQNRRVAGRFAAPGTELDARGKDVVVIGGGDTGADCVGTALRQGARSVTQVQYHDRPPQRGDVLLHWPRPVPQYRPSDHDAEGCHRIWGWNTVAFEGDGGGVRALVLQELRWRRDDAGRWHREALPGRTRRLRAQLVLIATGYAHPAHGDLVRRLALAVDGRGNVRADDTDYRTDRAGVFACGDARRGQSLVVWAIREGRQCARAVDIHLSGGSELPEV
jgi:glutamate synthase (NADPH/NADH) small chain